MFSYNGSEAKLARWVFRASAGVPETGPERRNLPLRIGFAPVRIARDQHPGARTVPIAATARDRRTGPIAHDWSGLEQMNRVTAAAFWASVEAWGHAW